MRYRLPTKTLERTKLECMFSLSLFVCVPDGSSLLMMGCYGLGVSRLIAAALEVLSRKHRMRWPCRIRPFDLAVMLSKVSRCGSDASASAACRVLSVPCFVDAL